MNNKRKIVVIGGGPAGLAAALSLTDPALHPNWRDEYEVTVLQLGWRVGGKGATGRQGETVFAGGEWRLEGDARIEEHGIHLFGNMYVNSMRLLNQCLHELITSPGEPPSTMDTDLVPSNYIELADYFDRRWHLTAQWLPHNNMQPWGIKDYPGPLVLIGEILRLVRDLVDEVIGIDPPANSDLAQHLQALEALLLHHEQHPALPSPEHHGDALDRIRAIAAAMKHRVQVTPRDGESGLYGRVRSVWCQVDMYATIANGVVADQIFQRGIDSVDGENFMDWLRRNGMDEAVVNSAPVQLPAEMCFQFSHGDTSMPPSFSASGYLWFSLRQILACGQATYWFSRGTGDTVVAPLYRVAVQRGVKFRFFNKVRHIGYDAAAQLIDSIDIDIQATTIDGAAYEPLVRLWNGTWAWPDNPIYGQLAQGEALRLTGDDLESWWTPWQPVATETMRRGEEFDDVVLAVPLPCLPLLAPELVAAAPWGPAVRGLGEIATVAAQFWTNRTSAQLGLPELPGTDRVCSGAAVPPLGIADMTDVLQAENWSEFGEDAPVGLYYVCGPLEHHGPWPPFDDHDTPAVALERARTTFVQWLKTGVSMFPFAGQNRAAPECFDFELLWCPPGVNATGEQRVNAQYVRANIDPNERYVPSPPGTVGLRPKAWESGAGNLALASDWIFTGINIGSFEGAVMSGMLAAFALTGEPALHDIAGYFFGRPPGSGT